MTRGPAENADDLIAGLSKEEAVEAVLGREGAAEDARDPEDVRAALDRVTDDGDVSWDAADGALAHASKVVSTPETRLEFAADAVEDAEEAARSVTDLDVVRLRQGDLEGRLSTLETAVAELAESLQGLVRQCDEREDLYAVARRLRDLTAEADRLHGVIEDLRMDAEEFEAWLGSHDVRVREFEEDVDSVAKSLDELADEVDLLEEAVQAETGGMSRGWDVGPDAIWFNANLRRRVSALLVADLRAELDTLRTLADREDVGASDRTDEIETRLDELDARVGEIADRLDGLAEPTWREEYEDRLAEIDATLDELQPPVDWGEVQARLETNLGDAGGADSVASGEAE